MIRRMAKKKPKNEVVLMVRMDATKHRKFKTFAFKSKRSMADLIRACVDAMLTLRQIGEIEATGRALVEWADKAIKAMGDRNGVSDAKSSKMSLGDK